MPEQVNTGAGAGAGEPVEMSELWRACNREMHERFREAFRGSDIPFGVVMLLRHITHQPGVTVSELARRSGVVKSHISNMMEQLVRQGLIDKRPDPDDQRLVRIYLTPTATTQMSDLEARVHSVWAAVVDEIPEGQSADVRRGLQILLEALRKSNRKVPPS